MDQTLQTLTIRDLKRMEPKLDEHGVGDDFFIVETDGKDIDRSRGVLNLVRYPLRFDGLMCYFCIKGSFRLDINLHTYEIHPNSIAIISPGNIIRLSDIDDDAIDDMRFILFAMSSSFASSINVDFIRLFQESIQSFNNPCVTLNEAQLDLAGDYFNLARKIINSPISNKKEVVGGLISSILYMAADVWSHNLIEAQPAAVAPSNRTKMVLERFLSLVTEYHSSQRNMAFYADKLCLTPKYLSKLIKQASGRSAPEWIDAFVILEAKNMLKYSDVTIKEIVYRLNFPNQSVFYKFFKAHTGMTPSEYRNG